MTDKNANTKFQNILFNNGDDPIQLPSIIDETREMDTVKLDNEVEAIEYVNDNIQKSINQAIKSFENAVMLAETTQSIRVYEALPSYLDSITNANKALIDIMEKKKKILNQTSTPDNVKNQTNIIMTSSEMLEHIIAKTGNMKIVKDK